VGEQQPCETLLLLPVRGTVYFLLSMRRGSRATGTNPRATKSNPRSVHFSPRQLGVNPRALGVSPNQLAELTPEQRAAMARTMQETGLIQLHNMLS
jgi:hypothetical protein